MTTTEVGASLAGGHARIVRPNWTKVHLIYFALATFDLMAIGGGLWLSEYTKTKFEAAIHSFRIGDLLRDNLSEVLSATLTLAEPMDELFVTGDPVATKLHLDAASKAFEAAISEDHYDEDTAPVLTAGGGAMNPGGHGGLAIWYPEINASFQAIELDIRALKKQEVAETEAAIASFAKGDKSQASDHVDKADEIGHQILGKLPDWLELSAQVSDDVVTASVASFSFATMMQYVIGGGILFMVMMVMTYAHFVGRLLRGKYDELETAHAHATEFSTELKAVNDDVVKLNVDLAANMKQLTEAHNEIVRKGKMAQLGQLTATVAHELRNPLGAVRTSTFLLERKLKDKGLGVETQIERIGNGVMRCDNIITQLLDFARSSSLDLKPVELDAWIARVLEDEVQKLPAAVEIAFIPGLDGIRAEADEGRLLRVMINLISNASEAMVGKAGDQPAFTGAAPKITVTTARTARGIEIEVRDNGPGMTPEVMEKILEPLFTTKNFGTGLGLPAVEKIMELHGGGLEVASEPGQGASFTAWLPVRERMAKVA